jgi:hypothetical protein
MTALRTPPLLYYPDFYPDPRWLRAVLLLNDEVCRIVPKDVELDDPPALREIEGELGALTRIAPEGAHTQPYASSAEWLDRVFEIIARERRSQGESRSISIRLSGAQVEFSGNVFLYDQKLSCRVREMLESHGLIDPAVQSLAESLHGMGGVMIPAAAANAILSFIADSIARDRGFTAITDQSLNFAMNTLLGLDVPIRAPSGSDEGILAGVFASILVPRDVGEIPFRDYKILRERSADLRTAFAQFVQECSDACRLHRIENASRLQQRIQDYGHAISEEFRKFQSGSAKALRFIRDWWPLTTGGVLAFAKDVVSPEWAITLGAAGQAIKFVQQATMPFPDRNKEKVFNLAAELGNDIRALPRISQLIGPRPRI